MSVQIRKRTQKGFAGVRERRGELGARLGGRQRIGVLKEPCWGRGGPRGRHPTQRESEEDATDRHPT